MKAYVDTDEWWPVHTLFDNDNAGSVHDSVEIDPELFATIVKVEALFNHYQKIIANMLVDQRK